MKSRQTMGPLKDENGNKIKEDRLIAELQNMFFGGVFTRKDMKEITQA